MGLSTLLEFFNSDVGSVALVEASVPSIEFICIVLMLPKRYSAKTCAGAF